MIFKIVTLFPEFFESPLRSGLLGKAIASGTIGVTITDIRDFATDRYRSCDDYPYGGGSGMVLMPGPLAGAVENIRTERTRVVLASASGSLLTQDLVKRLASHEEICLLCGHYEGVDQRFIDRYVDDEVSIGDYVLSGGEFAALVIMDAVSRYVPGFMSNSDSLVEESFEMDLLEYPHYTRPEDIFGMRVPEVLMSGNHRLIREWRREESVNKTKRVRPDLYRKYLARKISGE
ncbi:MAG TPA: tRNA (guanosine(37)-N1)-methyltransferase TrmD [Spirochaetota bacterium]|mgnify:CR=1 FL=1|nr:tRNA (guanosine(37)-N1)-methyltransferase TrmD [Spirochaetota bacterium]HPG50238.1 tRNA (guanosine(37)-N1)-methyltransferase TrmD [Spirochaetota bacterium]HPN12773.1 tRNA (guanosine(37)-N1)-methyltransferase TrmD [Spirochaetota bacterium]HQL81855.1 tRNA (guanosine(37)-N1)-methyltransferase TrmD [Spirochaetota bacterium]